MNPQPSLSIRNSKRQIRLEPEVCEIELLLDPPRVILVYGIMRNQQVKKYHLKITGSEKLSLF